MAFDSVSDGYDKLRARRLGLPDGMKAIDDTELQGKRPYKKRKTCQRDKHTAKKLESAKWREL